MIAGPLYDKMGRDSKMTSSPFDQIVGGKLSAVGFGLGHYPSLQFDGPSISVMTPVMVICNQSMAVTGDEQFKNRLCAQIGKVVANVQLSEEESLNLIFDDSSRVSISLKPDDYTGPETVVFHGHGNTIVVI